MFSENLIKYASSISDSQFEKIRQMARTKSNVSQEELSQQLGVSVSTLRNELKSRNVKWRGPIYKLKKKQVFNKDVKEYRTNAYYANPKSNQIKPAWGSGYSNIR